MLQLVESLSLSSGAACVAVLSASIGFALGALQSRGIAYGTAVVLALAIAVLVYWSPVLLGAQSAEYGSWFPVFLAYWFPAGAIAAVAAVFLRRKLFNHAPAPHA